MASIHSSEIQVLLAIDGETLLLAHGRARRVEVRMEIDGRFNRSPGTLIMEIDLSRIETISPDLSPSGNGPFIEGEYRAIDHHGDQKRLPCQPLVIDHKES